MENERLKIWLGFWRFVIGSCAVTLISTLLNHQIQKARLKMDAQSIEDNYVQKFLSEFMGSSFQERTAFINFLRFVTVDEGRRKNYDTLYRFLVFETTNNAQKTESAGKTLDLELNEKLKQFEEEQARLLMLNRKYNEASQTEKQKIARDLSKQNDVVDSLLKEAEKSQNKIVANENLSEQIRKDISGEKDPPKTSRVNTFAGPLDIDLQRGESYLVSGLDVTIIAQKVNNITNKALVWIKTGEFENNPSYYLGVNKYAIFSKAGVNYKLLVTSVYNDEGVNRSRVKMTLSKAE